MASPISATRPWPQVRAGQPGPHRRVHAIGANQDVSLDLTPVREPRGHGLAAVLDAGAATELVIDAYHDLADALAASHAAGPGPRARLEGRARAYRSWALAQPHRYRLLFGPLLPGYDAHARRLVDAAQRTMDQLLDILRESGDGTLEPPAEPLASQLAAWAQPRVPGTGPATALRAVLIWSRLHGIVSLEIAGNWASMGLDPGQLFEAQLATLTT